MLVTDKQNWILFCKSAIYLINVFYVNPVLLAFILPKLKDNISTVWRPAAVETFDPMEQGNQGRIMDGV